jgi:beta-hydroxylase
MIEQKKTQSIRRRITHTLGKKFLKGIARLQARHSLLPNDPILPNTCFDWVPMMEGAYLDIREEFERVWLHPESIPAFHQLSPDQSRISTADNWKTYPFFVFGRPVGQNCTQCPKTSALLRKLPGIQNAWFSILAPNYRIPPHRGPTKALVRCHLGIKVPRDKSSCWLRVDKSIYTWSEGKCVLFDDTYEHEVHNDTEEYRAVLFVDIDRPMDKFGNLMNKGILRLMKATHYVKEPMRNISIWNNNLRSKKADASAKKIG